MYNYEELKNAAVAPDAKQEDINALGEWFDLYGDRYWNGEYYDVDGRRLFPILQQDEESELIEITGYEFR